MENLEKESETLANRLIEGQVSNAQYAEESYQLKRENCTLKKQIEGKENPNIDQILIPNGQQTSQDFTALYEELEILRESVNKLSEVKIISNLYSSTKSPFQENRNLQSTPHIEIASLQEELTLYKMRNAEAEVNIDEIRQRISDLNREWQLHDQTCKTLRESNPTNDTQETYQILAHELLSFKIREAQTDCDNKFLSQQVMDLETQKQVSYNQLKRQDEEMQRIRLELEQSRIRENELRTQFNEIKNQIHDGELKVKWI